jgi:hypothetical protein
MICDDLAPMLAVMVMLLLMIMMVVPIVPASTQFRPQKRFLFEQKDCNKIHLTLETPLCLPRKLTCACASLSSLFLSPQRRGCSGRSGRTAID